MNLCSAKVASGALCRAWAIHDSDPPLCPTHAGLLSAPRSSGKAATHGFYQRKFSLDEPEPLFAGAENVALKQEAALIRVVLHRLTQYLLDNELPFAQIRSIAPLFFTGTRALAYIQRQVIETDDKERWDEALDELSEWLDVDL